MDYSLEWLSGRENLSEILLGYPQYHSGDNEYSYCNLFWRLDKICYFYKSHYTITTGACGLYWNSMLCERLDGRTGILLRKTQGYFRIFLCLSIFNAIPDVFLPSIFQDSYHQERARQGYLHNALLYDSYILP